MKCNVSFILILAITVFFSCSDGENTEETQDTIIELEADTGVIISDEMTEVIYFVSTPGEIVEVLNEADLSYKAGLVHDFSKTDNYLVQTSQALNLGVYSADLAYCAFYDEISTSANLFIGVQNLCRKLEVSYLIDNAQLARLKRNLHTPDSIKALSKEYNKLIYDYFIENGKENVLTLISTGGFVESLYLALNSIDKLDPETPIARVIAEQKYVFEVLRDFAYQQKEDAIVAIVLDDIAELDKLFSTIKPTKIQKTTVENNNGKIVIGGKNNLIIDQTQFKNLKTIVTKIRNKYINL